MINTKANYLFWALSSVVLVIGFGLTFGSIKVALLWVLLFLPITVLVSNWFNSILIPKYLLSGRIVKFWLYTIYTLVISLYGQMMIALLTFVFLANMKIDNMSPVMTNLFVLGSVMYLIVLVKTTIMFIESNSEQKKLIEKLREQRSAKEEGFVHVTVRRKSVKISYESILWIESQSDYVEFTMEGSETITTKGTISRLVEELPPSFLRVHRSFIINKEKVESYSSKEVTINGTHIPIGRTFKSIVNQEMA